MRLSTHSRSPPSIMPMKKLPPRVEEELLRIRPYFPALFFVSGFIFDIATLGRIDNVFNILSHGAYLILIFIVLRNQILLSTPRPGASTAELFFFRYQNEILHFLLGALLNAFIIFYFKSGTLSNSFLLLLILSALLLANEMPALKRQGPPIKVALITLSLISYFIYLLPVLLGKAGFMVFVSSLFCAGGILFAAWYYLLQKKVDQKKIFSDLLLPAGAVFFLFIILYGYKIIPPVPLSLKHIGIYHDIEQSEGNYLLSRQTPLWKFWKRGDQEFHAQPGDRIYLFTKIFSPGGFKGRVYLHFQYSPKGGKWETTDRIPMNIAGGREQGFRGYAYKRNYHEGSWRALVETSEGLEIGRISFRVFISKIPAKRKYYTEIH